MLGSGAIVVMDETTDMVKACWRVVRFFARSLRQVHALPRGHDVARADPRRILDGTAGPRTSTCCSTCATTSARASRGRRADDDLPARPVGGVADRSALRASATSSSTTSRTAVRWTARVPRAAHV
jgi:hypothetical protein